MQWLGASPGAPTLATCLRRPDGGSCPRSRVISIHGVNPKAGPVRALVACCGCAAAARLVDVTEAQCRPARVDDLAFLATMLGEAAVWRPEKPTPTGAQVIADPRYAMYLEGWPRPGDCGLVAVDGGPVGAAWYRTFTEARHGYGYVDEDIPELSIAVVATRRREGLGRQLLSDLIDLSIARGCLALSLSVREENPARHLYESLGFVLVQKHGSSWTMIRTAVRSD